VRPLLECSRAKIMDYLKIRGIAYREDASNLDLKYQRNRVRRELIPYLEKNFNPRLADTLAREAELARDVAGYLEAQAKIALESFRVSNAEGLVLPVQRILELHPALQKSVVRLALRECRGNLRGIAAHHIEDILALCRPLHSGRRIKLPGGSMVARQFGSILFKKDEPCPPPVFSYRLIIPGRCLVPEAELEFSATLVESGATADGPSESGPFRAVLEADSLPAELTIRSRRPGDRYGGSRHRKVKKMMIDAKVPLYARDRLPVVAAGEVVIWIPGFRPAKVYIAQPDSSRSVIIEAYERTTR
jgi:tRNA(Ile)-lysidine synthase